MKHPFVWLLVLGAAGYYGWQKYGTTPPAPGGPGQAIAGQETAPGKPADGYALLTAGKPREAAQAFEAIIAKLDGKTDPELPRAIFHLGKSYLAMDNAVAATRQFQRLVDNFAKNDHAGSALVELARLEPDAGKQSELLLRAMDLHPRVPTVGAVAYDLGMKLLEEGKELEGWKALTTALRGAPAGDRAQAIRTKLEPIVKRHLFSAAATPLATSYTVKAGDVLVRIARQHGVEVGMIQRANNMRSTDIYPNQRLKIVTGTWTIEVVVSRFLLTVYHEGRWVREWPVGTGKPEESPTPIGAFTITSKLVTPPWKGIPFGAPENILGTRWMGFEEMPSYGVHGTTQPDTVGKALSAGCVRMRNADVEFLYDLVPMRTRGEIRE